MDDRFELLNHALIVELAGAMSLPQSGVTLKTLDLIFGRATRKFSTLALGLDREIERHGSSAGLRWFLPNFVAGYSARGEEIVPGDGPLLIVSNHPASYDALIISAFVNRPDYKIITGEIPPYRYLPHISRHAIFSPPVKNTFGRMQAVRNIVKHLNDDGATLIFPRGGIEPDPAFMPNPDAEFDKWSRSLEIFLKRVPRTRVLVITVSGVISPIAMRHPITRFRKARPDRQRLAYIYQMIRQILSGQELFGLIPRVTFGEVLSSTKHEHILSEVGQAARRTLKRHMEWAG